MEKENYKGQAILGLIKKTDQHIQEKDMYYKLSKDPFLLFYFGKYYFDFRETDTKIVAIDYFAGVTIPYMITEDQKKEDELIIIERKGVSGFSDKETLIFHTYMSNKGWIADTIQNKNTIATINSTTTIDPQTGIIQEIQGTQNLSIKGQKVKKSTIRIQKI